MCVVAPDRPTMNEYVRHGENGLLYDPDHPQALDFSNARALGLAARRSIEHGFVRWQAQIPALQSFILEPARMENASRSPVASSPRMRAVGALNALKRRWPVFGALVGSTASATARFFRQRR